MSNKSTAFEKLRPFLEKRRSLYHLISIINYDIATTAPRKAIEKESEMLSLIETEKAKISLNKEYKDLVVELKENPASPMEKRLAEILTKETVLMDNMPLETFQKISNDFRKSNEMWRICKPKDDFATWLPYFSLVVEGAKKKAEALRGNDNITLYEALLRQYEPGSSEEVLDRVFAELKAGLLPLIRHLPNDPFPIEPYSIVSQKLLSNDLLETIGFDFSHGVIRESLHPFSDDGSRFDTRMTTKYLVNDFRSNLFSCLHEGGHCIQFQNKSEKEYEYFLEGASTAAQCETHSRFYENIIGRNPAFAPTLKRLCGKNLDTAFMSLEIPSFLRLLNQARPTLIRTEADELTYSIHIIIRYEIEKELINGRIEPKDVPLLWNDLYFKYLGIKVPSDELGCMQDVHWSDGEFGYFPSYALGNIYGAMIKETMEASIGLSGLIADGEFGIIRKTFKELDFAYDWMKPEEWILKLTGKDLDPKPYIKQLKEKYEKK